MEALERGISEFGENNLITFKLKSIFTFRFKMVVRVATDERPFETPSSDESGLGRDSPSEEPEPEAALVS